MNKVKNIYNDFFKSADRNPPPKPNELNQTNQTNQVPSANNISNHVNIAGNDLVKKMQSTMKDLAETVKSNTSNFANHTVSQSKQAFNDFLSNQYSSTLDAADKGKNWANSKAKDAIMDTLTKLTDGASFIVDGKWGGITDNALKNIYGFAHSLLAFKSDFPNVKTDYSTKDLDQLKDLIFLDAKSAERNVSEGIAERADAITNQLKKVIVMYNDFRRDFANPAYKAIVDGKTKFDQYKNDALTSAEQTLVNSENVIQNVDLLGDGKKLINIPLNTLNDKSKFEQLLELNHIPLTDALKTLQQIKNSLNARSQRASESGSLVDKGLPE